MTLERLEMYSCAACGNIMSGDEWRDSVTADPYNDKEFECPECTAQLNEDELYPIQ
jgi:DNA-directed RNA polymerase subunit RPC12/RpoP